MGTHDVDLNFDFSLLCFILPSLPMQIIMSKPAGGPRRDAAPGGMDED